MVKKKKNTTSKTQGKQTQKKISKLPKFNYFIFGDSTISTSKNITVSHLKVF